MPNFKPINQLSAEKSHFKVYNIARVKNGKSRPKQASPSKVIFSQIIINIFIAFGQMLHSYQILRHLVESLLRNSKLKFIA